MKILNNEFHYFWKDWFDGENYRVSLNSAIAHKERHDVNTVKNNNRTVLLKKILKNLFLLFVLFLLLSFKVTKKMNKKIEVCYEFMNKLPVFLNSRSRSFLSYVVDDKKFTVNFFYDKKKFKDVDEPIDNFLEELKKSRLCEHGWLTQKCLIFELKVGEISMVTRHILITQL